ncbi:uncharacterized protein V1513DRAFT_452671 [Lipomyces chichibuensis]|uniref:uncharacterized protein n=1 Tax=Lipomyces chichibuensis TaxID=1546026 RepID=UPI0033432E38
MTVYLISVYRHWVIILQCLIHNPALPSTRIFCPQLVIRSSCMWQKATTITVCTEGEVLTRRLSAMRIVHKQNNMRLRSRTVEIYNSLDRSRASPDEPPNEEQDEQQDQAYEPPEDWAHETLFVERSDRDCAVCGLSLCDASSLRRHIRRYHGLNVQPRQHGAVQLSAKPDRRAYMGRQYLERRMRQGLLRTGSLTARRLVDDACAIRDNIVLDGDFKLLVLRAGLLPLLQDFNECVLPEAAEMADLVAAFMSRVMDIRRPTISQSTAEKVPQVARFLKDCEAYFQLKTRQQSATAFLPMWIDPTELVPPGFGLDGRQQQNRQEHADADEEQVAPAQFAFSEVDDQLESSQRMVSTQFEDAVSTPVEDAVSTEFEDEDAVSTQFEDAVSTQFEDAVSTQFEDAASTTQFEDAVSTEFKDAVSTQFEDAVSTQRSESATNAEVSPLELVVAQGLVNLDQHGSIVVPRGMLTCPLCVAVGMPEHVYNSTSNVYHHLRNVHRVQVARRNSRMSRPRAQSGSMRRLTTLTTRYTVNGVSGERVRRLFHTLLASGLSSLSKAETIVHALEPVAEVYPAFEAEALAEAKRQIHEAWDGPEVGLVELSWPLVLEFVVAARAYAQLKSAQVSSGWLPVEVDECALGIEALKMGQFKKLASRALKACIDARTLERAVPRPTNITSFVVEVSPMLHLDATWAEALWNVILDSAVQYARSAYTPALSFRKAHQLAPAYVVRWVFANVLYRYLGILPGSVEWEQVDDHFVAHPEKRLRCPDSSIRVVRGVIVAVGRDFLQSAGVGWADQ